MKYNIQHHLLAIALLFLISGMSLRVKAQDYCVSGNCNNNTYMTSIDPNTIDYDNMVSVFHSSVVREADGVIKIWGQGTAQNGSGGTNGPSGGNITTPTEITSAGYGSGSNQLSGDILKFAAGSNQNSQQFTVLTTNGLFVWGNSGTMIPAVPNAATGSFRKVNIGTFGTSGTKADGLPLGVNPEDVKMMFGTRDGLAIVTCTGQAWMLTSNGNAYGDGATDNATNDIVWHRVSTASNTPLTGVVAVRGTYQAMMALTADGNIYTWGVGTRLGNNSAPESRPFATLMEKPAGITPKMIGMTYSSSNTGGNVAGRSYYLLATDGRLFSMGQNGQRQLGLGDNTARNAWVQVTASDAGTTTETISNNVMWISPQEHDGNGLYAAISILTDDGKLWSWGSNSNGMLGTGGTSSVDNVDPHYMPGRTTGSHDVNLLNLTDQLLALETGGHTTMVIKQCSTKFGYVGHAIRGSMANGTESDTSVSSYSFNTADLMICGAVAGPIVEDLKICEGQLADLADAESTFLPPGATGINWWADASATVPVPNPSAVGTGTYYATFDGVSVICPSEMTVSYLEPGEPGYELCVEICTKPVGGEDFSWNFPGTAPSPVTQTFNQPPSNYGFVLDIYSLDNSFNMEINGVDIALQEIEFQSSGTGGINVRFLDGDEYETDTEGDIWEMTGTSENPLIRVIISPTGNISLFGSKTSGGPLFPLELFNGNSLNTITWNSGASNTIIASQNVVGDTNISGSGYGLNSVACPCVKPGAAGSPAGFSTVGILTKGNPTVSNWPEVVPNGYLVLDASQKGMVVSHLTTTQRDALTAVNGMVIYNTDEGCVQVYRGQTPVIENQRTGWNCLKRGCNEE